MCVRDGNCGKWLKNCTIHPISHLRGALNIDRHCNTLKAARPNVIISVQIIVCCFVSLTRLPSFSVFPHAMPNKVKAYELQSKCVWFFWASRATFAESRPFTRQDQE
jgi:hypothetical protein